MKINKSSLIQIYLLLFKQDPFWMADMVYDDELLEKHDFALTSNGDLTTDNMNDEVPLCFTSKDLKFERNLKDAMAVFGIGL